MAYIFKEELSEDISNKNKFLLQLFDQQRLWVYTTLLLNTCLYCAMLSNYQISYDLSLMQNEKAMIPSRDFEKTKSDLQSQQKELTAYLASLPISDKLAERVLIVVAETINMIASGQLVSNDSIQQLDAINEEIQSFADGIQDDVCCTLGSDGKVRNVISYNNILCVQYFMPDRERLEHVKKKIKYCLSSKEAQIEKRAKSAQVSSGYPPVIAFLPENESPSGFDEFGALHEVWFRATSESAADLTALGLNIYYELTKIHIPVRVVLMTNMRYSDSIKSDDRDFTKYYCNNFLWAIQHLKGHIYSQQIKQSEIIVLTEESAVQSSKALQFLDSDASNLYERTGCEDIEDKQTDRIYLKQRYKLKQEYLYDGGIIMHKDVGIITVLPEESTAVRSIYHLEEIKFEMDDRLYYHGTVQGDGVVHSIVMTQAFNPGPTSIISTYMNLMAKFSPSVILVVGIAGGIDDDLNLCDVVVPGEVFCYDMAKDTPDGIVRRGSSYRIEPKLIPTIQRLQQTVREMRLGGRDFKVSFDPIGSGSVVIAHKLSIITSYLKGVNSKVAAVEMEASGICSAVYEDGVDLKQPIYGVMNFRGISDHADENKPSTKESRIPAAENAALISYEFVRLLPRLKARG